MCVRNSSGNQAETSRDWYFEDATVKAAFELTKELMEKYNIPVYQVIRHHDVTGKICPNPYVWNHTKHTWDAFKAALVAPAEYTLGWNNDKNGWWYADSKTSYNKSCWQIINGHKYYFNPDGYTVTGWQVIDGKDYYFEPRAWRPLECALYVSDLHGVQGPGAF